uniref:Laminin EGF-like domain-containing protein n=1 Tax=Hucho hucho TaxID=62062 RepID=A0A4W5MRY1_9TELE
MITYNCIHHTVVFVYPHLTLVYPHLTLVYPHLTLVYPHLTLVYPHLTLIYPHLTLVYPHLTLVYPHLTLVYPSPECLCSAEGSLSNVCDPVSGQCPCRPHLQGLTCELCSHGYWNPSSPRGCEPCRCDPTNSHGDTCDQSTGQCQCRSGFGGRTCTECPDNTYGDPLIGCRSCQCAVGGTEPGGCDKRTGACRCRLGVTGARCDACTRGHCDSFPDCEVCPSCFFSLDSNIQNLTLGLERLSSRIPSLPGGSLPTSLGPRIRTLEATLTQIRDSLPLPPSSARQVNDALSQLRRLRDQLDQVDGDLSPQSRAPELGTQLDELQALLDGLGLVYNTKRDALRNSVNSNNAGAFSSIKDAYDDSTDSAKSVDASGKTVEQSKAVRKDALDLQNQVQPANTRELEKLNHQLNTKPDLTPTAKQVCGSVRFAPCTPAQCDGELCPAEGAPPCGRGERCEGALPLGTRAVSDTEEVKDRLKQLNGKITQAAAQIQETQDTANKVRQSTDDLANQMRLARDDLYADLQETRDFVKELKDFLSGETLTVMFQYLQ